MLALGFSPGFSSTHWALASAHWDERHPDALALTVEQTGTCRLRDLPTQISSLPPPEHVVIPFSSSRRHAAGHWIGTFRIRRLFRWHCAFPAPTTLSGHDVLAAFVGDPEAIDSFISGSESVRDAYTEGLVHLFRMVAEAVDEPVTPLERLELPVRSETAAAFAAVVFLLADFGVTYQPSVGNVTVTAGPGDRRASARTLGRAAMRVLGFAPGFGSTHWVLIAGHRDERDPQALTIDIERTGHCRLRDLPDEVGRLATPDLVVLNDERWHAAGHWVGTSRIRRFCRRQEGWPAPRLSNAATTRTAFFGVADPDAPFPGDPELFPHDIDQVFVHLVLVIAEALNDPLNAPLQPRSKTNAAITAVVFLLEGFGVTFRPDIGNVAIIPEHGTRPATAPSLWPDQRRGRPPAPRRRRKRKRQRQRRKRGGGGRAPDSRPAP